MTEGPESRSVMPDISVMRGSVLLGGLNRRNKEKKIGTFIVIVHPLLLGFHSDSVRSSSILLYQLCSITASKRIELESPGWSGFVTNSKPDQT